VLVPGLVVNTGDVHLESRDDGQGSQTGTGVAYVQFSRRC